jgi:hypothetical protein
LLRNGLPGATAIPRWACSTTKVDTLRSQIDNVIANASYKEYATPLAGSLRAINRASGNPG